jgi:hypothetical protein
MAVTKHTTDELKKETTMSKNLESIDIDKLLTEADELMEQIRSDAFSDLEETHRLEFEKHAQELKRIKAEVQDKIEKKGLSEIGANTEGMHEAILDIVKAMKGLTKYLS